LIWVFCVIFLSLSVILCLSLVKEFSLLGLCHVFDSCLQFGMY